jgi:hypothetical protein
MKIATPLKFSYGLYLAVVIANIAGYMEAKDVINVPDDEELTETICEIVNEYNDGDYGSTANMFDFAYNKLLAIYGI